MRITKHAEKDKAIIKASINERIIFDNFQNYIPQIEITNISKVEGMEHWDVIIQSGATLAVCEIKCRKYSKKAYAREGWIIEKRKKDELQKIIRTERGKKNDLKAFYINFFIDGVLIWDVSELSSKGADIDDMAVTTAGASNAKRPKENYKLKNADAIAEYDWQINYEKFAANAITIYNFLFPHKQGIFKKIK